MSHLESVAELLLHWEDLRAQGRTVSAEELCLDRPELLDEVRRRLRAIEAVYRLPRGDEPTGLAPPERSLPAPVGPPAYELLGELGRGGMGVVYEARHLALHRTVALKMILAGRHAGSQERARFEAEAEAAAGLSHPNIVRVFEIGEHDGLPWLALEYVEGGSLARKLAGTPLPARPAAELALALARAVQHAHERGVVHRDLKPGNVLLTADGTPKVSDFGLAKRQGEAGLTRTGDVLGTPGYMAPEQAAGRTREVGPLADVYALGAILYECLTGRPPFVGASALDTIEQVLTQAPVPPALLQPRTPRDLEAVCLRCLEKEPARRYRSAQELADDLARFVAGEPTRARASGVVDRLAGMVSRGHYDVRFLSWGTVLMWLTPVPVLAQLPALAQTLAGEPLGASAVVGSLGCAALMLSAMWWCDRGRPASGPVERQAWSILFGNGLALAVTAAVFYSSGGGDAIALYPRWAIVSGLTFFILGGGYWGGAYLIGLAFFALALLLPWFPAWGPLGLGLVLGSALLVLGLRLRRLGREAAGTR